MASLPRQNGSPPAGIGSDQGHHMDKRDRSVRVSVTRTAMNEGLEASTLTFAIPSSGNNYCNISPLQRDLKSLIVWVRK